MKKNLRKAMSIVIAMLVICANASVLATAVPQKSEGGSTTTQQKYEEDTKKVIDSISSKESDSSDSRKTSSDTSSVTDSKSDSSKDDESKDSKDSTETEKSSSTSKTTTSDTSKSSTSKTSTTKSDSETSTSSSKKTAASSSSSKAKATATPKASSTPKATSSSSQKTTTVSTIKPKTTSEADEDLDNEETDNQNAQSGIIITDPDTEPSVNVVTNSEKVNTKRYLTKGGAFGMFLLTVLVSAVLSFLISYRFYKMNRTDSHVMAEIRALKRDIDSKMSGNVGGFSEYETRTSNSNPSYSRSTQGIKRENAEGNADTSREMYSKWESQIGQNGRSATRENAGEGRYSRSGRSTSGRTQSQRGNSSKIKDVFGDMFSKKK